MGGDDDAVIGELAEDDHRFRATTFRLSRTNLAKLVRYRPSLHPSRSRPKSPHTRKCPCHRGPMRGAKPRHVERRGTVLLIGINRPQAQNRFDPPIIIGIGKEGFESCFLQRGVT